MNSKEELLEKQASAPTSAPTPAVSAGVSVETNAAGTEDEITFQPGITATIDLGDGKIFTFDLQEAVRIRTNETGESAL